MTVGDVSRGRKERVDLQGLDDQQQGSGRKLPSTMGRSLAEERRKGEDYETRIEQSRKIREDEGRR